MRVVRCRDGTDNSTQQVVSHLSDELRYLRGIVKSLTKNKARAHREKWVEALPETIAAALSGVGRSMSSPPVPMRRRGGLGGKKKRPTGNKRRLKRAAQDVSDMDLNAFGFLQVRCPHLTPLHHLTP